MLVGLLNNLDVGIRGKEDITDDSKDRAPEARVRVAPLPGSAENRKESIWGRTPRVTFGPS